MGPQRPTPRFGVGRDVLVAWFGSCVGGWIGLPLGWLAFTMLETTTTEGLTDLSEGLMILGLCLVGGPLTGAAVGAAVALKAIGVDRAVASGVVISLWLLVTVPVVWTAGSLVFPFEKGSLLASALLAIAGASFISSFIVRTASRGRAT